MTTVTLRDGRTVTVRRAVPEDAPALVDLINRCYSERIYYHCSSYDRTPEQEAKRINSSEIIFVAEAAPGELIGWVDLSPWPAEFLRHQGSMGIGIAPAYRDGGLGAHLLHAVIEGARAAGLERICLNVNGSNTRAIRAYEKAGFVHEGRQVRAIKDGDRYDDVVMMGLMLD